MELLGEAASPGYTVKTMVPRYVTRLIAVLVEIILCTLKISKYVHRLIAHLVNAVPESLRMPKCVRRIIAKLGKPALRVLGIPIYIRQDHASGEGCTGSPEEIKACSSLIRSSDKHYTGA